MFLGDLIGTPVLEAGRQVGYLNDVRLFIPDHTPGQQVGTPMVHGIVVCPRRASSFVGYERKAVREPRLLAGLFAWRTRGSFLIQWADVLTWAEGGVEIRQGATHWSPALG